MDGGIEHRWNLCGAAGLFLAAALCVSCDLAAAGGTVQVVVPAVPAWVPASLAAGSSWTIRSPALEGPVTVPGASGGSVELALAAFAAEGTWVTARLRGADGSCLSTLGCVLPRAAPGMAGTEQRLAVAGGAACRVLDGLDAASPGAGRCFNGRRLEAEFTARTGARSWLVDCAALVALAAADSFRSDRIALPRPPEGDLRFVAGQARPDPVAEGWRSLEEVCAPGPLLDEADAWRCGTRRWWSSARQTVVEVTVRPDGRVTMLGEP